MERKIKAIFPDHEVKILTSFKDETELENAATNLIAGLLDQGHKVQFRFEMTDEWLNIYITPSKEKKVMNLVTAGLFCLMMLVCSGVSSCGKEDGGSPSDPTSAVQNSKATGAGKASSYYVTDVSQLMACNATSTGYLAYVKSTAQFMACDGSSWAAVDVKGKDGKDGVQGAQGAAGAPVASNIWYDAISSKTWLIPSLAIAYSSTQCSGNGYRIPTGAEMVLAIQRGLLAKSTTTFAWADNGADMYCIQNTCQNGAEHAGDKDTNGGNAGHYCVTP